MCVQHYIHGVYNLIYIILEISIITVARHKVNCFTFEVAGWMWPDPVGKHVPLTRDTELINSYQLTLTTSSQHTLRAGNLFTAFTMTEEFIHYKVRGGMRLRLCEVLHMGFPVLICDWRV